jgi:hypothetical protein
MNAPHPDSLPVTSPSPARPVWHLLRMALIAWAFGLAFFLLPIVRGLSTICCAVAMALGGAAVLRGLWILLARRRELAGEGRAGIGNATATGVLMFLLGLVSAYISLFQFMRGRQLRRFGRVLLPKVARGGAWAHLPGEVDVEPALRGPLAAQWRENGRTEHASVAAFARLTLDLMALGAPPALLAAAQRDAADEIRHTELCFSLARSLDGQAESPAPFPEAARARTLPKARVPALSRLAVDSLIDGALHEGLSARMIARLADRCEVPAIRALLRELAADEGRHSAHGWDVVRWCVAEGGAPVVEALRGAVAVLPAEMRSPLPDAAAGGAWERFGIHGHALEAEEYAKARAHLAERVAALA